MGLRTVFKGGIVSGKFNVDLTPEFVVRLSSSFGTTLDPGAVVTLGRDSSASALVAKRAMTAALLGTGVNVRDLRAAHAGVVRHDVLAGKSSAGAHVRAGEDPDDVEILFFSSDATPMTESDQRSVEKVFVREEYRRAYTPDVGDLIFPGRAVEQYVERLERAADREKTSGTTVVVDFSGGVASLVASRVFTRLGINAVVMEGFANANVAGAARMNLEEGLDRVSRIVPTVEAAFGCVVGPTGEDVQFVDDRGEFVSPDVMLACLMDRLHPPKVVLPINLSHGYAELVESGGGTVESSRTGLGNVAIKAAGVGADLASLADGRYIFPAFLPAPDCFMTLARALEAFRDESLSQTRAKFGEHFGNVARERLECPWAAKGRVMRGLAEKFGGDPDAILTDGVKLNVEGGWVLMLPDPDNPVFYVYAEPEGGNGARPKEIMGEYVELVRSLIDGQD
jgi:mannose-1-phosphate guanylyltransferase/phosphomannomutase